MMSARYRRNNRPSIVRNPQCFATFPHPIPALISNCLSGGATLVGPDRPTGKEEQDNKVPLATIHRDL